MSGSVFSFVKGITILSACNGVYLNRGNKWSQGLAIAWLLFYVESTYLIQADMRSKFTEWKYLLAYLYYLSLPLFRMGHAMVVFRQSGAILENLAKVLRDLKPCNRNRIHKMSFVLLLLWIVSNVILSVVKGYYYHQELMRTKQVQTILRYSVFMIDSIVSNYIDFGILLFTFNVYCGHILTLNYLLTIKWSWHRMNDDDFPREVLIELRKKQSLKQSVQDTLAILPVIWFLDFFMAGSAMVIVGRRLTSHNMLIIQMLPIAENVIMVVICVSVMDVLRDRELAKIPEAVDAIVTSVGSLTNEHLALMKQLAQYNNDINACGLFNINKSFLLSFLGAVISFSVLLIQMTGVMR
ncbi:hypothetical protein HDE_00177 [Halotydeus destructor]|nr:hypothetical protein HDE_00177 [Halotydeus destructor]